MNKTLVLGASANERRYSNMAIQRLVSHHIPTVAIGLKEASVAGIPIDTGKPYYTDIDTVTLYLNPKRQSDYYEYIIGLKPKRVIFNPGTENLEFYAYLKECNIEVVPACTLVMLATNQYKTQKSE